MIAIAPGMPTSAPSCAKCGDSGTVISERSSYNQPHPCYPGFDVVDIDEIPCPYCDAGILALQAEKAEKRAWRERIAAEAACPMIALAVASYNYIPF